MSFSCKTYSTLYLGKSSVTYYAFCSIGVQDQISQLCFEWVMCLQNSSFCTTIVVRYYAESDPKIGHSVCTPKLHYLAIKFMSYFKGWYEYPRSFHLIVTIQSTNAWLGNFGSNLCLHKSIGTKHIQSQYCPHRHIEATNSKEEHSKIDAKQG